MHARYIILGGCEWPRVWEADPRQLTFDAAARRHLCSASSLRRVDAGEEFYFLAFYEARGDQRDCASGDEARICAAFCGGGDARGGDYRERGALPHGAGRQAKSFGR